MSLGLMSSLNPWLLLQSTSCPAGSLSYKRSGSGKQPADEIEPGIYPGLEHGQRGSETERGKGIGSLGFFLV